MTTSSAPIDQGVAHARMDLQGLVARLVAERPSFHSSGGKARIWNAQPETLALIARHAMPGCRSLETGCGASTVVFAAAGTHHVAISPAGDEHSRIAAYCELIGVDCGSVDFREGFSDEVLPGLEPRERLDLAFVDGGHSFPHPVVDWHFVSRRLRTGGVLLVDDIPIPAVAVVYRAMLDDPAWELLDLADHRAAAFRKVAEAPEGDDWRLQAFNRRYPDYSFVSPARRLPLRASELSRRLRRNAAKRHPRLTRAYRLVFRRSRARAGAPTGEGDAL
jgi:predicted O-methyltransferase YrrM